MQFQTPILFLVFNRPDTTQKVFDRIKLLKPAFLFVAADGPRSFKPGEEELCKEVRSIIKEGIDWECDFQFLFRDENLGCGKSVSGAITWFFEQVEEGIILEDDTLPDLSFFPYCEELLVKYRNAPEVLMISGDNFRLDKNNIGDSYAFSRYSNIWGWATWKRVWRLYDFNMKDWPKLSSKDFLKKTLRHDYEIEYWTEKFDRTHKGLEDTWDWQLQYLCFKQNGVSIEPAVNLVKNLGFGEGATHTVMPTDFWIFGNLNVGSLLLEQHPKKIMRDRAGDKITFINRYLNGNKPEWYQNFIITDKLFKLKEYLFPSSRFGLKQRVLNARRSIASKISGR
jgi:hypothetical protein